MKLSLLEAEEALIKLGKTTRDQIEKSKNSHHFGHKKCEITLRFLKAVKEDFSPFFPAEPDRKYFNQKAIRLFKAGGKS